MRLSAILEAMVASGTTPEQMLAVVKAAEQSNADALEKRRSSDRDRQAKHRGHVMSRYVTLVTRDSCDTLPTPQDSSLPLSETPEVIQTPPTPIAPPANGKSHQKSKGGVAYPADFALLWNEFPHHPNASKLEAFKSWSLLPEEDRDKCLDGAMAYARYLGEQRQKRSDYPGLHLTTFVNQRRWESLLEQRH